MMNRGPQAIEAFLAHRVITDSWDGPERGVTLVIAPSGEGWMLTRSDGLGGGVFLTLKAALSEARDEAAMLTRVRLTVRDRDGIETTTHYAYGRLSRPTLPAEASTARVSLNG